MPAFPRRSRHTRSVVRPGPPVSNRRQTFVRAEEIWWSADDQPREALSRCLEWPQTVGSRGGGGSHARKAAPRLNRIVLGDNLQVLPAFEDGTFRLIYIDPPYNTGSTRRQTRLRTSRDEDGDRTGFGGRRYRTVELGTRAYADAFDDYLGFLKPRLRELRRVLSEDGSLFVRPASGGGHPIPIPSGGRRVLGAPAGILRSLTLERRAGPSRRGGS